MFNVADYLKKFAKFAEDSETVRQVITRAMFEVCGTAGVPFETRKGIIYIQGTPTLKSLMFMNKERLLEKIRAELPKMRILDIR